MAVEYKNGKPYFYRKVRRGDKVISEYVAAGALAYYCADIEEDKRYAKEAKRNELRELQAQDQKVDDELMRFELIMDELFTLVALASGYHKSQGVWRKKHQQSTTKETAS